jgi:Asp-tRNA(Asn)/Glu-tRNA(Gln) amidotransferase C subunit
MFVEVGSKAGVDASAINQILGGMNVGKQFASLRGLKGEDFQKELSAVIGSVLDDAALAIFSSFKDFAEFGEGMLETVLRVVDTNNKINQQIKNVGINSGELSFAITETLAKAAGGLDRFLEQSQFFRDNFLTEAERLAPVQKAVAEEISRLSALGFTSADGLVDTREEFKLLVQSLKNLSTTAGQEAYQALMNVQEGFIKVTEAAAKEAEQRAGLQEELNRVGKTTQQLREIELSQLYENNRALQKEIWYREDMLTSLNDTIKKFQSFSKSLKDFRDNLVIGSSSILTPLEKYAETKLQFENTYTKALSGDVEAQGKLTNSAQTFLNASQEYFASSSEYTNDFNSVLAKIGYGITSAEASVSVAELQLTALSTQTDLLSSINTNIAILAGVPQMARGGLATGMTLVGEQGPELVDFSQPGRVYNTDQTAGMFVPQASVNSSMGAVVAELRQVKAEIAQLRKQQTQETGHLITATYDAQNKNAEIVTEGVVKATKAQSWSQQAQQAAVVK